MATPFDFKAQAQTSVAVQPTGPQLDLIRRLLAERDWQSADNEKYVARVSSIAVALDHGTTGEEINAYLHSVVLPPLPKPGASMLIDWLKERPTRSQQQQEQRRPAHNPDLPGADVVPAGRYALFTIGEGANNIAFYRVDRPTEGKWAGYVFVKQIVGGDEHRVSFDAGKRVLRRIAGEGAESASARYGHEIGECGMCGRQLTNEESRARGIGPICAAKAGW